ncbi:MAG: hypothetical protein EBX41_10395, partial [Chitinophagia bacterium]|nr:hypothetical protein [Chitinophagia bacterium]
FLVAITLFSMVFHVGRPRTWVSRIVTHWEKQKRSADKKNPYGTTAEEKTRNWQSRQSEIAIANSNYVGVGMGRSKQVIFLPQADSDFLFSIIIEQFGVWGSALLLMIYLSLLWFVMQLFDSFKYAFGSIFSVGYCIVFVFQALVHMAINVGIFPVTGLTLPLVSTGGTSILINSMAFGLILSISRSAKQMAKDAQNAVKQATENTNLNPANDTTSFPTPIPIINPNNNKTY